jgi:hypothetical protein
MGRVSSVWEMTNLEHDFFLCVDERPFVHFAAGRCCVGQFARFADDEEMRKVVLHLLPTRLLHFFAAKKKLFKK